MKLYFITLVTTCMLSATVFTQFDKTNLYPIWQSPPIGEGGSTLYGFMNEKGEVIVQPTYEYVHLFSEGLACVQKNFAFGFIDTTGKVVIPLRFDGCEDFRNGTCDVIDKKTGEEVVIDRSGKVIDPGDEAFFAFPPESGFYWRNYSGEEPKKSGLYKVLSGVPTLVKEDNDCRSEQMTLFSGLEGLFPVYSEKTPRKYGFMDTLGNMVLDFQYDFAYPFSDGMAWVQSQGKCGLIDKRGNWLLQPSFAFANGESQGAGIAEPFLYRFSKGISLVCVEEEGVFKVRYIDVNGNVLWKEQ